MLLQSLFSALILFTLRGTVVDPMGAPIAGAAIAVTSDVNGATVTAVTDDRGAFAMELPAGRHTVVVSATAFDSLTEVVAVDRAGAETRQFMLHVAGIEEAVSVSAPLPRYHLPAVTTATRTATALRDVPQAVTVITKDLIQDQLMLSVADVVRYVPGISSHQGENNRDQVVIRGNNSSADFFVDGVRDDVQYYRDLYNLDRVEALKGPNAMIFGRGGGGGVINRVTKEATFAPQREVMLLAGSFGDKRVTADFGGAASDRVAVRLNGLFETSDSFRQSVALERYGINPTLTFDASPQTRITVGYEHFHDQRVADRGIPSYRGRPIDAAISTYFGNPADSHVNARVDIASATLTHQAAAITIHNRTLVGDYDRGYQNFVPGAVSADRTQVSLTAYNNATARLNLFNQTDITSVVSTGTIKHTLLAGAEIGRQLTDNFRNTGYFNNATTSILVPYANPLTTTPVAWRQSTTDADNHLQTTVAAAYGQDQIDLSHVVQVVAGLRFDVFDLQFHNNRNGDTLGRVDRLVSPRAGVVIKPMAPLSLYGSYTVSYLPSAGDQFSSLTTVTEQVKPEKFSNYELGAKLDVRANLFLTTALYRLDRTNTRSTDPNDPTRIVQTGSQRTNGFEAGLTGQVTRAWQVTGGYAFQDAFVTSATTAAAAGALIAQVPRHTLSLWNMYEVHPKASLGLGVVKRTDMFAAIDNTVTLPGYTDVDAAFYLSLTRQLRLQTNVENLFNRTFYANADNNTNISPGSPRALRIALTARF